MREGSKTAGRALRETLTDYSRVGGDAEIRDGLLVEGVPGHARRGDAEGFRREHGGRKLNLALLVSANLARNDFRRQ